MKKKFCSYLSVTAAIYLVLVSSVMAYPAAGGGPSKSCMSCHDNDVFNNNVSFYLIDKATGENVVRGNTAYIPIKRGQKQSYKLVLGGNEKTTIPPKTIGWMLVLPGGVSTELPNCIRLLNSGQKFRYKQEQGSKLLENDNLTVATQTFFFDGNVGNFNEALYGEIRAAVGERKKGKKALGYQTLKLVFTP